jgi:putative endopeptidase
MRLHPLAALAASAFTVLTARAGIDLKNFDPAAQPQIDFFQYANGGWLKANPVPAAYSTWGAFNEVDEHNKVALHRILEHAATVEQPGSVEELVGGFYASGMNETAANIAGISPLQVDLTHLAGIASVSDVQAAMAILHHYKIRAGFIFASEPDPKDSTMVIAGLGQAGLGLPDRDYYFRDDEKSRKLRDQYVAHVAKMFELAGDQPDAASAAAAAVMKLETALAKGSKTNLALRDPLAN